MLQRILELPRARRSRATTLRCAAGDRAQRLGAARRAGARARWTRFGDVLYNLYGSTEVAWATIATPEDLRAAPGTAGRPPLRHGREAARRATAARSPPGEAGRIFVANEMMFEGYTGGGGKEIVGGLMSTGDVGHFDDGRAPVRRRPRRRNDRLRRRERVPARGRGPARRPRRRSRRPPSSASTDEEFGQRLKAFVVAARRRELTEDERQGLRQGRTSPASRCRARWCSSTSCRATRPARCSSASSRRATSAAPAVAAAASVQASASLAWRHGRADPRLRPRGAAAERRRGPAAGAGRADRAAELGGERYDGATPARRAGRARRLAHDGRRLRAAPALRGRARADRACAA